VGRGRRQGPVECFVFEARAKPPPRRRPSPVGSERRRSERRRQQHGAPTQPAYPERLRRQQTGAVCRACADSSGSSSIRGQASRRPYLRAGRRRRRRFSADAASPACQAGPSPRSSRACSAPVAAEGRSGLLPTSIHHDTRSQLQPLSPSGLVSSGAGRHVGIHCRCAAAATFASGSRFSA
jgi:hypothetical protein